MGCSIIREGLAAFHSETTEKIGRFAKWCICFIYHLQSGVYAIYTTCASIGKMAPLVYIYIYIEDVHGMCYSLSVMFHVSPCSSEEERKHGIQEQGSPILHTCIIGACGREWDLPSEVERGKGNI